MGAVSQRNWERMARHAQKSTKQNHNLGDSWSLIVYHFPHNISDVDVYGLSELPKHSPSLTFSL